MKKLDIYILRSITSTFLVSFLIVTAVMLLGNTIKIYDILFAKGMNLVTLGKILSDAALFLSIFIIPMALTLGINFTYTQLSANSEITAMRSAGIPVIRIFLPALIFTLFVFLLLFYDISFVAYKARGSYKKLLIEALRNKIYVGLNQNVFYTSLKGSTLYAEYISPDKREMKDVFFSRNGTVIAAKKAIFHDTENGVIVVFYKAHLYSSKGNSIEYGKVGKYILSLCVGNAEKPFFKKNDTRYMTINQLIHLYRTTGSKEALFKINKMLLLSLSVFVLSLMAFTSGLTLARSGKSAGALISLSIFFTFYILEMFGESIFKAYGNVWAIWLPDSTLLLVGVYMLYKKSRI